ncbi:drug/metabolite transporter (DMT)-like permease [Catalinimonas alkaloidigena]|uniref:DMT family transporter n=1 Tax=Catalinimonas alkaloidigena TaxID=1075417 RepID=UPI002405BD79|nr:DMT family transporter [Catalinimonas alkaloidigena]MDF9796713.1 drug/metabolite transporter (DMT)-like permease [Catalinimonas alkaloidigena]
MQISKGVKYMLLATFLFACMNVLVKWVTQIPAVEVVFFRSVISLVLSYSILKAKGIHIWGNNKPLLIARGASGAVGLVLYFVIIQQIPLATAVTLQFLAPIVTAILGVLILGERFRFWQGIFFVLSFCGILIVNGFDARVEIIHILMGIMAALGAGMAYTIIRKLKKSEHPLVIVMYFPLVTVPITGAYSAWNWVMPQGIEWLTLLGIGLLTQFAQYFLTKSFQEEEINKVASLKYLNIIYALCFGYIFFGETFNIYTYLGMMLVVGGVILNIWYKQKISKAEKEMVSLKHTA